MSKPADRRRLRYGGGPDAV